MTNIVSNILSTLLLLVPGAWQEKWQAIYFTKLWNVFQLLTETEENIFLLHYNLQYNFRDIKQIIK